jgi:hypothetical protein
MFAASMLQVAKTQLQKRGCTVPPVLLCVWVLAELLVGDCVAWKLVCADTCAQFSVGAGLVFLTQQRHMAIACSKKQAPGHVQRAFV